MLQSAEVIELTIITSEDHNEIWLWSVPCEGVSIWILRFHLHDNIRFLGEATRECLTVTKLGGTSDKYLMLASHVSASSKSIQLYAHPAALYIRHKIPSELLNTAANLLVLLLVQCCLSSLYRVSFRLYISSLYSSNTGWPVKTRQV